MYLVAVERGLGDLGVPELLQRHLVHEQVRGGPRNGALVLFRFVDKGMRQRVSEIEMALNRLRDERTGIVYCMLLHNHESIACRLPNTHLIAGDDKVLHQERREQKDGADCHHVEPGRILQGHE